MPKSAHQYKDGASFRKVIMLYRFDKKLRLLIFNEIEKIEIAVRRAVMQITAEMTGDDFWLTNPAHFASRDVFNDTFRTIKKEYDHSREEVDDLESIGDCCFSLARTLSRKRENCKEHFTPLQLEQIHAMENLVGEALSLMTETLKQPEGEGHDISRSYAIEEQINALRTQLRNENLQNIAAGQYDYSLGAFYIDYVNGLESLGDYVLNVVQSKARQTRV